MFWLQAAWDWFFGWAGLSTLIAIAATAVAILTPPLLAQWIPGLRALAINVAIGAAAFTTVSGYYYVQGAAFVRSEWEQALKKEKTDGEEARTDAERTVRAEPPDSVRDDPCNRDKWEPGQQAC